LNLAITLDEDAGLASCYVNGPLRQRLSYDGSLDNIDWTDNERVHMLGGNFYSGNTDYFKCKIGSLSLYESVRTAEEIYADAKAPGEATDALMLHVNTLEVGELFTDSSPNGNDIFHYDPLFEKEEKDPDSYAYSIAIVGDTQTLTYSNPAALTELYDWIIANKESKKIGFVV
jgi:hypothetical protein